MPVANEPEWLTRKKRIDPLLDAAGWARFAGHQNHRVAGRTEEEETSNGPADYALWLDDRIVSVVEAKKLTVGPQNVLTQAERYAKGLPQVGWNFHGLRCPRKPFGFSPRRIPCGIRPSMRGTSSLTRS